MIRTLTLALLAIVFITLSRGCRDSVDPGPTPLTIREPAEQELIADDLLGPSSTLLDVLTGEPVANQKVTVFVLSPDAFDERVKGLPSQVRNQLFLKTVYGTTTDADGRFRIGTHVVVPGSKAFLHAQRQSADRSRIDELFLALEPDADHWSAPETLTLGDPANGATVSGRVTLDGKPLEDVVIRISLGGLHPLGHQTLFTDSDGRYTLSGQHLVEMFEEIRTLAINLDFIPLRARLAAVAPDLDIETLRDPWLSPFHRSLTKSSGAYARITQDFDLKSP